MYERMLDQQALPSIEEMRAHCGEAGELFALANEWLSETFGTVQKIVFPYGNRYGWGVAHRKKSKLICNIFAENHAFTAMVRLSGKQFASVYKQVGEDTRGLIDDRYLCGDGGWIHYRVTDKECFHEFQLLLTAKCTA